MWGPASSTRRPALQTAAENSGPPEQDARKRTPGQPGGVRRRQAGQARAEEPLLSAGAIRGTWRQEAAPKPAGTVAEQGRSARRERSSPVPEDHLLPRARNVRCLDVG